MKLFSPYRITVQTHYCNNATVTCSLVKIFFSFRNVLEHFIIGFLIIIVANVPQGLPAMVISQLAIIARRLGKKNVFIKKLDVIDELGAATVIAVDKTGTITHNHVVLTDMWYNRRHHSGKSVELLNLNFIRRIKC